MTKEQWLAIKNRDRQYDGRFWYAVKGSKKVCRPSCPRRCGDPKRVILFDRLEDALRQGYQPCSRCRPELPAWNGARAELAGAAEKLIRSRSAEKFSLPALADALHVDKYYLVRTFRAVTGRTPLEYHNLVRCEAAKELLTRPEIAISYIASEVGFVSASHFAQVFRRTVGCSPSAYRENYLKSLDE